MSDVIVLTRIGDRKPVHIVKSEIVEWYANDDGPGTMIKLANGSFRIVNEDVGEVAKLWTGEV